MLRVCVLFVVAVVCIGCRPYFESRFVDQIYIHPSYFVRCVCALAVCTGVVLLFIPLLS